MIFTEQFYGEANHADFFTDIQVAPDGGYIAVGQIQETDKSGEIYLVKFDANGEQIFAENFGTETLDVAHAVVVLTDRYIIGGSTFSAATKTNNCYLLSVSFAGELLEETTFGGNGEDIIYSMTRLSNGQIGVASTLENALTGADINVRLYDENLN
ncbi:MAG: hypothetical protein ACI9XO_005042 [Paraglaciecola sp.]|jgi:hypothetical protein